MPRTRISFGLPLLVLLGAPTAAQTEPVPDRAGIERAIQDYFAASDDRDPQRLAAAFHPGAIMFWVDGDGRLRSRDQASWKARLADRSRESSPARDRRILWIDQAGDGACVATLSRFTDHQFHDFLCLLRLGERWRIVGKVFANQPVGAPEDSRSAPANDTRHQIEALIRRKFAAMDANDGGLLASAYLPQAQTATPQDGELVAWPIAEWVARFDAAAAEGERPDDVERRIERIEVADNVAWARFTHTRPGHRVVDYALLVRSGGVWRIAHLDYLVQR